MRSLQCWVVGYESLRTGLTYYVQSRRQGLPISTTANSEDAKLFRYKDEADEAFKETIARCLSWGNRYRPFLIVVAR